MQKAPNFKSLADPITRGIYIEVNTPCPGILVAKTGHGVQKRNKMVKMDNVMGARFLVPSQSKPLHNKTKYSLFCS